VGTDGTFEQHESAAVKRLAAAGIADCRRDAQLLLMAAAQVDKSALIARGKDVCPSVAATRFEQMIARRIAGEPVYRIIGKRDFHGLTLFLNDATLEPRDDTECLVDLVLQQIDDPHDTARFLDLGTGTGAIALALLSELPAATALATDLSSDALQMAQKNSLFNGLESRTTFLSSDWLQQVVGQFDFIVSNPPYIESATLEQLATEVIAHDPRRALDGGELGLDAYRIILATAVDHLVPHGFLALEIGSQQRAAVAELAGLSGWVLRQTGQDLAGRDRALVFSRADNPRHDDTKGTE